MFCRAKPATASTSESLQPRRHRGEKGGLAGVALGESGPHSMQPGCRAPEAVAHPFCGEKDPGRVRVELTGWTLLWGLKIGLSRFIIAIRELHTT